MSFFKKSAKDNKPHNHSAPTIGGSRPAKSKNTTVIGSTLSIKGELSADEDLIIEGRIEGTIAHHRKRLTIGKKGRVKADIHASSVVVLGTLVGDIFSETLVTLAKDSDVTGNISCANISMESGASFRGTISTVDSPKVSSVPKESTQTDTAPAIAARHGGSLLTTSN